MTKIKLLKLNKPKQKILIKHKGPKISFNI